VTIETTLILNAEIEERRKQNAETESNAEKSWREEGREKGER
jgi:hypothetical protein